jgi:hypothetical protein
MPDITEENAQLNPDEIIRRGFYVVRRSDGKRIWLAEDLRDAAKNLDAVIFLNFENADAWWIDYCLGADAQGRMVWIDSDQTVIVLELQTVLRLIAL